MLHPLLLSIRSVRETLMAYVQERQAPPASMSRKVLDFVSQLTRTELDDRQLALAWGEMQLLLVECEGRPEDALVWGQIRNALDACMVGILKRKEWDGLQELFARGIFPRLAAAVAAPRGTRMQAVIESTTRLRDMANSPAGEPWRWRLLQIAEMQYPRFGTSGWRARMGVDFTWRRAEAVAQAIVEYVIAGGLEALPLTIGYDSRINADRIAALVAEIAVANGLTVQLAARETPSPALIHHTTETLGVGHNAGLINCTPSHNPVKDPLRRGYFGTEYHGIRYNMPYGGVAPGSATDGIGRRAMELLLEDVVVPTDRARGSVSYFDPLENYANAAIKDLGTEVSGPKGYRIDAVNLMKGYWGAPDAMVVIDEMHSASRGYLRRICDKLGIRYTVVHGEKDPLLGELLYANPEEPHTATLQDTVRRLSAEYPRIIGLGFDTDSDRFGVVDAHGAYLLTNDMLPMLTEYLLTSAYNGVPGKIIRNMVTTRMLDRIADAYPDRIIPPPDAAAIVPHAAASNYTTVLGDTTRQSGYNTFVVPVGFKNIAEVMMDELLAAIKAGEHDSKRLQKVFHLCLERLLIAGEESNGMTSRGHAPDKDGLWAALLTLQMCAVREQSLEEIRQEIVTKYGELVSVRRDVQAPDAAKEALVNVYQERYGEMAHTIAIPDPLLAKLIPVYCGGVRGELVEVILQDETGTEAYMAIRASGTEPINRIYVEAPTVVMRDAILRAVGEELERQIIQQLAQAPEVSEIIELLDAVELPPVEGGDLPATYNTRVTAAAVARIRDVGGSKAEEMLQRADRELADRNPAKAGALYGG